MTRAVMRTIMLLAVSMAKISDGLSFTGTGTFGYVTCMLVCRAVKHHRKQAFGPCRLSSNLNDGGTFSNSSSARRLENSGSGIDTNAFFIRAMNHCYRMRICASDKAYWEDTSLIPGLPNDIALLCLARVPRVELLKLRMVCTSWKHLFESQEFCDLRQKVGSAEAWLYVLAEKPSGTPFKALDPHSNQWFTLPEIAGSSKDSVWQGFECVALGPTLLVMGGIRQSISADMQVYSSGVVCADVFAYNACTNRWSKVASMNTPRSWFAATVMGDFVYVAGGRGKDCFLNSVEVYNSKQNSWSTLPGMNCVRSSCYGLTLHHKIWVIGGEVMRNQHSDKPGRGSAEVYDPENNSWSLISEMWLNTQKVPGPSTVHCGRVLSVHQSKLMMYLDEEHSWCHVGDLSGAEMFSNQTSRYGFACESVNDELYVVGGMRISRQYRHSVQSLNTTEVCKLVYSQGRPRYTKWRNLAAMRECEGAILASAVMTL